eukprot:2775642-Pyramimonas_sp.AAC.1
MASKVSVGALCAEHSGTPMGFNFWEQPVQAVMDSCRIDSFACLSCVPNQDARELHWLQTASAQRWTNCRCRDQMAVLVQHTGYGCVEREKGPSWIELVGEESKGARLIE